MSKLDWAGPGRLLLQDITRNDLDPQKPGMEFLLSSLKYSPEMKGWTATKTLHTALMIANQFPNLEVEMGVKKWINEQRQAKRMLFPWPEEHLRGQILRQYQIDGKVFIRRRQGVLLADVMGLGKTVQAIAAVNGKKPVLVICPNSLKDWWYSQIIELTGMNEEEAIQKVLVAGQGKNALDTSNGRALIDYDWVIVHWELLRLKGTLKKLQWTRWSAIIADEAHRIKRSKTQTAKGLYTLGANQRIALTATPYTRLPSDLFGILKWLNPDVYTSYWKFYALYVKYVEGDFGRIELGPRNEKMMAWELADIMLRRELADVMDEIPETTYTTIPVTLERQQQETYKKVCNEVLIELGGEDGGKGELVIPNAIARITRLRQVAVDPNLVDLPGGSAKYEALMDLIEDMGDEPLVVFTTFVEAARRIWELLSDPHGLNKTVALYIGQHHSDYAKKEGRSRETELARFVNREAQVLVGTTAAMGEGLNLQRSRRVVFVDLPFSLVEYTQAIGRVRPGLYGKAEVVTIEAKGTIDRAVHKIIKHKLEGADALYYALSTLRGSS